MSLKKSIDSWREIDSVDEGPIGGSSSPSKIADLSDKLKHMEMKDILDIDLGIEDHNLQKYLENFRKESFEAEENNRLLPNSESLINETNRKK